jgi:chemotaxis protein methyltransferase CheR
MLSHRHLSRFFRDKHVFEVLRKRVLPDIAARVAGERRAAHIWSAGCASGEEPLSVKIVWDEEVARSIPGARLSIVATDINRAMLDRARRGCAPASLRELPQHFVDQVFDREGALYCIKPR